MWRRGISADNGVALVIVLMAVLLLGALGLMLVLNTLTEVMVAGHYRLAQEAFYAADGVAERAMDELAGNLDWNSVLIGAHPTSGERPTDAANGRKSVAWRRAGEGLR